jgi:hypothetical protein
MAAAGNYYTYQGIVWRQDGSSMSLQDSTVGRGEQDKYDGNLIHG